GPTFEKIVASGHRRVIGSFKLCIDASGKIISVSRLRSTGFVGYDATIINTIRNTWSYRPFTVNGKPVPVCTAVTFIYSLR
ncbi:MAG: energy transducer TonB, partial [Kofleriaceae bacterium]